MTMSRDNRLWCTERIRGELLELGVVVSNRSIRRYRWRGPTYSPTQTWRTFLANRARHPVGRRPVHGVYPDVQDALRTRLHRAWSARTRARQGDN
jgi:hypothetical protein